MTTSRQSEIKVFLEKEIGKKFTQSRVLSENILVLDNEYFIKSFKDSSHKEAEIQGIKLINEYLVDLDNNLKTPYVFYNKKDSIIYGYISTSRNTSSEKKFADQLYDLHECTGRKFGFPNDNFIGLGRQTNSLSDDWGDFFFNHRLCKMAETSKNIRWLESLNDNQKKIINLLNDHNPSPSPLHGDLWSGNVIFNGDDNFLIDPAVYYGDREVDLAMTELFGGFNKSFYDNYFSKYKRDQKYEIRKIIYNLYHLINHYNIFGESYFGSVERSLKTINHY